VPVDPDSPFTSRVILRFDLSGLPSGVITDAYFTFSVRFLEQLTVSIRRLGDADPQDAAPVSGGFLEGSITADNAPPLTGTGFVTGVGQ
jgi:hypothetical protein